MLEASFLAQASELQAELAQARAALGELRAAGHLGLICGSAMGGLGCGGARLLLARVGLYFVPRARGGIGRRRTLA